MDQRKEESSKMDSDSIAKRGGEDANQGNSGAGRPAAAQTEATPPTDVVHQHWQQQPAPAVIIQVFGSDMIYPTPNRQAGIPVNVPVCPNPRCINDTCPFRHPWRQQRSPPGPGIPVNVPVCPNRRCINDTCPFRHPWRQQRSPPGPGIPVNVPICPNPRCINDTCPFRHPWRQQRQPPGPIIAPNCPNPFCSWDGCPYFHPERQAPNPVACSDPSCTDNHPRRLHDANPDGDDRGDGK